MISCVAAISRGRVLANKGKLPWDGDLPGDVAWFRRITLHHTIVMGYTTFATFHKPLRDRRHIVLSRHERPVPPGVLLVHSLEEALELLDPSEETMVIGGGQVFEQFLPFADRLYVTYVEADFTGDTLFPVIEDSEWKITEERLHPADARNKYAYRIVTYDRKNPV